VDSIKQIVAKNISVLRQANGMTQLELAERLHYSDKAVSKWERGESLPDIAVLKEMADLFGVPLDYLVREEHPEPDLPAPKKPTYRKGVIAAAAVVAVWLLAMTAFVVMSLLPLEGRFAALTFLYAVPPSLVVWLVLNTLWFRPSFNVVIISLLLWAVY